MVVKQSAGIDFPLRVKTGVRMMIPKRFIARFGDEYIPKGHQMG